MKGHATEDLIGDIDLSDILELTGPIENKEQKQPVSDFKVKLPEGVVMDDTMCEYYLFKGVLINKYHYIMRPNVVETAPNQVTRGVICTHQDGFKHFITVEPALLFETADEYPFEKKTTVKPKKETQETAEQLEDEEVIIFKERMKSKSLAESIPLKRMTPAEEEKVKKEVI